MERNHATMQVRVQAHWLDIVRMWGLGIFNIKQKTSPMAWMLFFVMNMMTLLKCGPECLFLELLAHAAWSPKSPRAPWQQEFLVWVVHRLLRLQVSLICQQYTFQLHPSCSDQDQKSCMRVRRTQEKFNWKNKMKKLPKSYFKHIH